ncbi:hypothetical protein D8M04_06875 [Oceanobacillus piezotolerans]|uniref:Polysaccharide deacetylase n=1 Tax=Oceanobacillus piezotolerans TaxID=2448030 RepID=A0A498DB48_9BACI|nr:hypothetical protein [Oceanobacillus piezotolerans]RLL46914.1 hypothetical protein D8M04_06875 [Oceanobacillus piezotolerans]
MNSFSYKEYIHILDLLQDHYPIMDYNEVGEDTDRFAVIRHDVEFSVERAYKMAELEARKGIFTSYMFQIRNNAYNTFSIQNIKMIKEIYQLGHKIGLHVHLGMLNDISGLKNYVESDIKSMGNFLHIPIDRFSYHRPPKEVLRKELSLENYINTYDKKYFDFKENDQDLEHVRIKYIADSKHRWNYGYPSEDLLKQYAKVQLLIHPYSWTEEGYESQKNFEELIKEKESIFRNTLKSETKHYKE